MRKEIVQRLYTVFWTIIVLTILAGIYGGFALHRYCNRPFYSNWFGRMEMTLVPSWYPRPLPTFDTDGNSYFYDLELNHILRLDNAVRRENKELTTVLRPVATPHDVTITNVLNGSSSDRLRFTPEPNTLAVISHENQIVTISLEDETAKAFQDQFRLHLDVPAQEIREFILEHTVGDKFHLLKLFDNHDDEVSTEVKPHE